MGTTRTGTMFNQLTQEEWSLIEKLGLEAETNRILKLQTQYPNSKLVERAEKEYMNKFFIQYSKNMQHSQHTSPVCIWIVKTILSPWGLHQTITNLKSRL